MNDPDKEQPLPDISPDLPKTAKVDIRKGFDEKGRPVLKALTTIQEVPEEHLYLLYRCYNKDVVVECDLLGDQLDKGSDGKLPPMIHLECPECSKPDKPGTLPENSERSILSISYGNKHYEIEDLERKDWGFVSNPDGSPLLHPERKEPVIVKRVLTVKEKIQCVYCKRYFRITDNIMSPA
jgi:hypothetical protein